MLHFLNGLTFRSLPIKAIKSLQQTERKDHENSTNIQNMEYHYGESGDTSKIISIAVVKSG